MLYQQINYYAPYTVKTAHTLITLYRYLLLFFVQLLLLDAWKMYEI